MNKEQMAAAEAAYDKERARNLYGAQGERLAKEAAHKAAAQAGKKR